jgi:BirA family biotin operon repressor/biotin-[acetyl-CoA-carboxylase] ligase
MGGILIETSVGQSFISDAIIGVGLNINQSDFPSDIPNPVSLRQIINKKVSRKELLGNILKNFSDIYYNTYYEQITKLYKRSLFRVSGYFYYRAKGENFLACIVDVLSDGRLVLEETDGTQTAFYFKEVEYVL